MSDEVARRYAEIATRRDEAVTAALARWAASRAATTRSTEAIDARAQAALSAPADTWVGPSGTPRVGPELDELDANEQVSSWLR
ncbi:hypothetical protein [Rhodococcus sp. X156]|uniref:hypothetical protein n=1 Tax=Rhodococcus sp. X156 TaxID=2499145 RepID=UPI000FD91EDF|nr:hypothetical protein [Rhodococcus sp. X156]